MEEAIKGGGADSRLITAELIIRGVPVTEIDYRYKEKQHSLALLGFNSEVRGDSSLFDIERAVLYAGIALLDGHRPRALSDALNRARNTSVIYGL